MVVERLTTRPRARPIRTGVLVLGPLPAFHRLLVVGVVLVTGICSGAWIALFTPLQVAASAGALIGAAAGGLAAVALVHDFSHPRQLRSPRRR